MQLLLAPHISPIYCNKPQNRKHGQKTVEIKNKSCNENREDCKLGFNNLKY